jgi:hypothetical protein
MKYFFMGFKKISDSKTTITELMVPAYANFGGKVHGVCCFH